MVLRHESLRSSSVLLSAALFMAAMPALADPKLPHWIDIRWERGPDLPQAFQDSGGGVVGNALVTTCGYCDSRDTAPASKKEKSGNGHHKKAWGLDLDRANSNWAELPDYPGAARQELSAISTGSELFTWGGFSYRPPFSFSDGYRLSHGNGRWQWEALPELPWRISSAAISIIGDSIYLFGGADFQLPENKYYTDADYSGKQARIGARLLVFNISFPQRGFRECAPCPGTPRFVAAMAAVGGKLYVIGGAAGQRNPTGTYCTVVDNWQYDPARDKWSRLRDTPIATGNFPAGAIVWAERYILLIGGFQYANVMNPDGTLRPSFGHVTKHYPDKDYCSDVLVFDVKKRSFGRATPLPLNNNRPTAVLRGDVLHLIGGETGGCVIDGEPYAHHPDLYLTGKLSKAPENKIEP